MKNESGLELVYQLWHHIENQEWDQAKKLLSEDFEAREYWAETFPAPEWRKHLSTPYDTRGLPNG